MQEKAKQLIEYGVESNFVDKNYILYGHRQVGATDCPGNNLFETIKTWPHWESRL